jgi:uncharacterized membrane protein
MRELSDPARRRWSMTSRVLAGTLGTYGLTSLATAALALLLARSGMAQVEAVYAATLGSFLLFTVIVMAVFNARSMVRAWLWLFAFAVPLALALFTFLMSPGA